MTSRSLRRLADSRAFGRKATPAPHSYTAAEDAVATIPGMQDARFWANSSADYNNALPSQPGPWLVFSSGGGDGAFGAACSSGLRAAGNRPDYAVVTGVSSGRVDGAICICRARRPTTKRCVTTTPGLSAADVFEAGRTSESCRFNSWPLKETDRQRDHAGPARRTSLRNIVAAAVCSSLLSISTLSARCLEHGCDRAHGGEDGLALFRR